jgi:integrase
MTRLTKTVVEKLPAPAAGYKLHWDSQDRGFGVRITREGKRSYVVQGRVHGREMRLTIGPHGVFTTDQARDAAREQLRSMRLGLDPRDIKNEARATAVTLREVADSYQRDRPLKESSKSEIERHVTTTFAAWLSKPLKGITRELVTKRFNEVKNSGLRGTRPAPAQANQAFSILRALFNYAIREYRKADGAPVITDNPVDVLYKKWNIVRPRTSRIPDSRVGAVWQFLQTAREEAYNRDTLASIDLVTFLLLTGARIGEASSLTWDQVNLDERWWHIPDPKNSNPVWLPLSSEAVRILKSRQRVEGSPFVFTSWGKSGHIKDPRDTMKRLSTVARMKLSPHDLRRTFTTIGVASCGIDLHKIELLTNHVPKTVTVRHYLETSRLQYLLPEAERIACWIVEQGATSQITVS